LAARYQAPAWERDCNKSFALNYKNEIELEKKQELLVQARSQAGAWEREKRKNVTAQQVLFLTIKEMNNI